MRASLWILALWLLGASAKDILFVNMWNSKSHAGTMLPLAKKLMNHGHNVTVYTQVLDSIGTLNGVGTVETIVPEKYERKGQNDVLNELIWNLEFTPDTIDQAYRIGEEYVVNSWSSESFQGIRRHHWDMVISDEMFPNAGFGLALDQNARFGSKIALFTTTDLFPTYSRQRALSRNPIQEPNYYTRIHQCSSYSPDRFLDRLLTIRDVIFEFARLELISEKVMRQSISHFGVTNFRWNDVYSRSELTFSDYPDRYSYPSAVSNQMIYTGSFCRGAEKFPEELEGFMNDPSKKGVIYVAFGSMVNWAGAPTGAVDAFFEMFKHFPDYNFIFSFKLIGYPVDKAGPNVKLLSWAPQKEIIAHNRTVLFFTHGGLKSLKEAICAETPVLVLPFFADQVRNALNMIHLGFAEYVSKRAITVGNIVKPMRKMLTDKKYAQNIVKVRSMFVDRIMDPLEEGAFWTDKMLRSERRINFEIIGSRLTYLEMFGFDLFVLFVVVLLVLV